ncbi:hypothetical protein FCJ61_06030 [Burkholderia metallica]|uniref:hypothetical protein n=1 Tax=Burkholderia metallica TaxID=488729 RepID=UPI00157B44E2|nr:hypothetical protein [Burkholderia metallica]NTZ82571.1 hypothetical protein [Burkholderia metallica]
MNPNTDLILPNSIGPAVAVSVGNAPKRGLDLRTFFLLLCATLATAVSLAIAAFAGWQRGGLPIERAMNVSLCCVAVLYVHWLPVVWRAVGVVARICAFAVWWLALAVVLFGQVSFFMLSQQHAGDERAASITMPAGPPGAVMQAGRTRTQITQDIATVKAALAQANARRCTGDCSALTARRQTLAARLAALDTEDGEALRRETDQDRQRKQADHAEALRDMSRADPVAQVVAARLHTTENLFALVVAVACAVVLEGSAILGWLLVSIAGGRVDGRDAVVGDRKAVVAGREGAVVTRAAVAPLCDVETVDHTASEHVPATVAALSENSYAADDGGAVTAADERRLEKIRNAVLAGTLDPTQESIRKLLRCGQPKAGRLNRLYQERYGCRTQKHVDSQTPELEASDVANV